jgi:hypothetical protein
LIAVDNEVESRWGISRVEVLGDFAWVEARAVTSGRAGKKKHPCLSG